MTFLNINKWIGGSGNSHGQSSSGPSAKQSYTPQVREIGQLIEDGPPRLDGSDKFFGLENVVNGEKFGNTCYCNSILQCLYFSKPFRESVVNFPHRALSSNKDITAVSSTFNVSSGQCENNPPANNGVNGTPTPSRTAPAKLNTDHPKLNSASNSPSSTLRNTRSPLSPITGKEDGKRKPIPVVATLTVPPSQRMEDPNTPETKKKAALAAGPVLKLDIGNYASYGMSESLFSALKDLFETIIAHGSRTGVVTPLRFVEILKRDNEMFRSSIHQDAHEFLNYVLNQVIENVEQYQRRLAINNRMNGALPPSQQRAVGKTSGESLTPSAQSSAASTASLATSSQTMSGSVPTGWIHDLFEGLLTSETKCLTCETVSRRDEVFLDLSIDLDKHASVTSCLRNFSASEMLCERNKFHCDGCGGLQEAEKRMKIKRLPRILALHLKRFKYSEEVGRHQKLFHRVVYPYYLRLFNTTDDAEDPDRLYELYAVVVHIGGGPYHGHYVSIIKTEDKGWLLFDDELVEPVDKSYIQNFFGDERKLACAYVLFYQETTFEKMQKEMQEENKIPEKVNATHASEAKEGEKVNMTLNGVPHDFDAEDDRLDREKPAILQAFNSPFPGSGTPATVSTVDFTPHGSKTSSTERVQLVTPKSKKERKEEKAAAKLAAKLAAEETGDGEDKEKEREKEKGGFKFRNPSKTLSRGHSWFHPHKKEKEEKEKDKSKKNQENEQPDAHDPLENGVATNGVPVNAAEHHTPPNTPPAESIPVPVAAADPPMANGHAVLAVKEPPILSRGLSKRRFGRPQSWDQMGPMNRGRERSNSVKEDHAPHGKRFGLSHHLSYQLLREDEKTTKQTVTTTQNISEQQQQQQQQVTEIPLETTQQQLRSQAQPQPQPQPLVEKPLPPPPLLKEKRKGFLSGLKRKTSIMLD